MISEQEARAAAGNWTPGAMESAARSACQNSRTMLLVAYAVQELARRVVERSGQVNYWLAEKSQYGYASVLLDGPHESREGVEKALYLINSLGLNRSTKNRDLCCVRVEQTLVEPKNHSVNEEALAACREMMK